MIAINTPRLEGIVDQVCERGFYVRQTDKKFSLYGRFEDNPELDSVHLKDKLEFSTRVHNDRLVVTDAKLLRKLAAVLCIRLTTLKWQESCIFHWPSFCRLFQMEQFKVRRMI